MGIFSRFSDIVNSNLHSLLDKAENPEKMVRLMIQEMEDTIVEVRSQLAGLLAKKKTLARQIHTQSTLSQEWQDKAAFAVEKERDDLARLALLEKKQCEALVDEARANDAAISESIAKLKDDIDKLEQKLKDAKAKQVSLIARHKALHSQQKIRDNLHKHDIDHAIARFDSYEEKLDHMQGRIDSQPLPKTLQQEIDTLKHDADLEAELAALKASQNNSDK